MSPGQLIKNYLESKNLRQVDICKNTSIYENYLSAIIKDKKIINIKFAYKLEKITGLSAELLMHSVVKHELNKLKNDSRENS